MITLPFRKLRSKAFTLLIPAFLALFAESGSSHAAQKGASYNDRHDGKAMVASFNVPPRDTAQDTLQLFENSRDTLSQKLSTWIKVTESDTVLSPAALMSFMRASPDWPRQAAFRDKIEKTVAGRVPDADIASWFQDRTPRSAQGITAYVNALTNLGQDSLARVKLAEFWREGSLTKDETAVLATRYKSLLTPQDHAARLDNMVWKESYAQAEAVLPYAPALAQTLAKTRMALARQTPQAPQMVQNLPDSLQKDEGLMFERLRWRRRQNLDAAALEALNLRPAVSRRPEIWWKEINILTRRAIEQKDYSKAYDIAQKHTLTTGSEFGQAEWLLGWLSLSANKPIQAYKHFDRMYGDVSSAISRSRAAYWAARTSEVLRDTAAARQWDRVAAQYPSTFYGQLSHAQIDSLAPALPPSAADSAAWQTFNTRESVRAARLLKQMNRPALADAFLAKIVADARTQAEYEMSARLARELDRPYYAVQANKDAQQKLGVFLFNDGYPALSMLPSSQPEKALVHAIVYRESMFKQDAKSSAGALGMMQLMPGTAREMAKKQGQPFSISRLTTDPNYNVTLGSGYLQQMLNRYDGFYPLAIAAYNAGPGNVSKWIEELGDPRKPGVDLVDWIEHIPIYETRNYVQRVMESYYVYRMRFNEKPRTIHSFSR